MKNTQILNKIPNIVKIQKSSEMNKLDDILITITQNNKYLKKYFRKDKNIRHKIHKYCMKNTLLIPKYIF